MDRLEQWYSNFLVHKSIPWIQSKWDISEISPWRLWIESLCEAHQAALLERTAVNPDSWIKTEGRKVHGVLRKGWNMEVSHLDDWEDGEDIKYKK